MLEYNKIDMLEGISVDKPTIWVSVLFVITGTLR